MKYMDDDLWSDLKMAKEQKDVPSKNGLGNNSRMVRDDAEVTHKKKHKPALLLKRGITDLRPKTKGGYRTLGREKTLLSPERAEYVAERPNRKKSLIWRL